MVYDDFIIYGPYTRKDGRQHVIAVKNFKKKTISYPKFLMEKHLNRLLSKDETVDHIDKDFTNNSIDNLRVLYRREHIIEDVLRNKDVTVICAFCGKEFKISGSSLHCRNRKDKGHTGYFCSKVCTGKYGKQVQLSGIKLPEQDNVIPEKYCNKMV